MKIRKSRGARVTWLVLCCVGLAACIQAPIQRYEGSHALREGRGGARETVDGIDIWTRGEPSGPYEVLAYTTVESPEGWIGGRILLSRVAERVRAAGGDAAVLGVERSRVDSTPLDRGRTMLEGRRVVEITIVRYRSRANGSRQVRWPKLTKLIKSDSVA
ncbi:hypothetical protein LMG23992_00210 [Cupriavidus laharis]|uniref:Lipoprotein n=1 Tax=Cupriavidus laharis TaxID=151654 RepID=A0ABM8WCT3_9BURK|nr:hypothetical protein [Cupriavidus laharis]CAG9165064.1 hypothetical protein LMG23992_00210 [Cupriavidus laharis]